MLIFKRIEENGKKPHVSLDSGKPGKPGKVRELNLPLKNLEKSFWARTTQLRTARKNEPLGVGRWVSPFWNQNKQYFALTKGEINLKTSILPPPPLPLNGSLFSTRIGDLRDRSKFMGYPGRVYRWGAKTFL